MLDLLIRVLAVWRVTRLVVDDELAAPLRDWVRDTTGQDSRWTYLVNCPYCVSVWAGLVVAVMPRRLATALALSSGTLGLRWAAEVAEQAVANGSRR